MNIVIEGSDNSGKSTLADIIAKVLNWRIVTSDGPTKTAIELNERARKFLGCNETIFDRHCVVSERVYGAMRGSIMTDPSLEQMFYAGSNLIIYCRTIEPSLEGHVIKLHDSAEHLAMVTRKQVQICRAYDRWALEHAHIMYRKGETPMRIVRFIMGELRK